MKTTTATLAILGLAALGAQAGVFLIDHPEGTGSNPYYPSADAPDYQIGWETTDQRFGLNAKEAVTQSFTLTSPLALESIFMAYNDYRETGTIQLTLDFGNDGSPDYSSGSITVSDLTSGTGNNARTDPRNWLEFDLSTEYLTLPVGLSSFTVTGLSEDGTGSFIIAPQYDIAKTGYAGYTDGAMSLSFAGTTGDLGFGITGTEVVPEPSSTLFLFGLVGLGLLRRQRA